MDFILKVKKKISIVGSAGIPSRYGGFETLAEELCHFLCDKYDITTICSTRFYRKNERTDSWNGTRRIFIRLNANGFQSILYDFVGIFRVIKKSDVILILGGSAAFTFPIIRAFFPKVKIVFHPDGLEWKRPKWSSLIKLYLKAATNAGCKFSHKVIIDNIALIKNYTSFHQKTEIISYGGYEAKVLNNSGLNYWLTIARAETDNNLEIIAKAFEDEPNQKWILLSNYRKTKYGIRLKEKFRNNKNIFFLDANYNKDYLRNIISGCKGLIHGHSAGGTNPSLVTAMWSDKVVLCHDNAFNRETTNNLAVFFSNSDELKILINSKIQPVKELKYLAQKEYSWKVICLKYDKLFEKCLSYDNTFSK